MNNLAVKNDNFLIMSEENVNKVRALEKYMFSLPDEGTLPTEHIIHGGMYSRTIKVPKGKVVAGVFIIIPTLLIINGHCALYAGEEAKEFNGYHVLCGFSDRKQALLAIEDTTATMIFATKSKTIADVEAEFTNEADLLWSRREDAFNNVTITGY